MRKVSLLGSPIGTAADQIKWLEIAVRTLAQASVESDPADIATGFSTTGTATPTRNLNVTSPTLANVVAVLGTLLTDLKRGGQNRTG